MLNIFVSRDIHKYKWYPLVMSSRFFSDVKATIKGAILEYGSIRKLAKAAGLNPSTVSKWLQEDSEASQRSPNLREVAPLMDLLNARVVISTQQDRERSKTGASSVDNANQERLVVELTERLNQLEKDRDYYKAKCEAYLEVITAQNGQRHTNSASLLHSGEAEEKSNVA